MFIKYALLLSQNTFMSNQIDNVIVVTIEFGIESNQLLLVVLGSVNSIRVCDSVLNLSKLTTQLEAVETPRHLRSWDMFDSSIIDR